MTVMQIRLATEKDIPKMREIFDYGREVQLQTGNLKQWAPGYPEKELILADMDEKAAHVCINDQDEIVAVLSVFTAPDPTYSEIEGSWLNDAPYVTIHRIATNGKEKGVGQYCLKWVQNQSDNVRIDTHKDNQPMKHVLTKLGFEYCGVIYLADGDARDAYHYAR